MKIVIASERNERSNLFKKGSVIARNPDILCRDDEAISVTYISGV